MAKDIGRQSALCAIAEFLFSELPTGVAVEVIDLEPGTVMLGGHASVATADNSGTSAVADVGDGDAGDLYVTDLDLKTAAGESEAFDVTELGKAYPSGGAITVTRTAVGTAATAGVVRVVIWYAVAGRVNEVRTTG